jgi:hypothetical protein
MKVKMKENGSPINYLTPGKEYEVIGLDHESFRVLDDKGEPILFLKSLFSVIDDRIPEDWIWERYSSDEFYANPPELHEPGFYEDFFDGKKEAVGRLNAYLQKHVLQPPPCRSSLT